MTRTPIAILVQELRDAYRGGEQTIAEIRAGFDELAGRYPPRGIAKFDRIDAGGVAAEWTTTSESKDSSDVVLFTHAGGYCFGSTLTHRNLVERISQYSGMRVLSLDYRLAPEHPFPAAVEDVVSAYRWLLKDTPASRIFLCGDSAGGGLAMGAAIAMKDAGLALPAGIVCISPLADLAYQGKTLKTLAHLDPVVRAESSMANAKRYLGAGADPRHPWASALYGDLTGFPPILVMVGAHEILLDNSTRLAERAREAGCVVELEVWDDMIHIWPFFADVLPEGDEAIRKVASFIKSLAAKSHQEVGMPILG